MKAQFAFAVVVGAGIALAALQFLDRGIDDAHVALEPGTKVAYRQSIRMTEGYADGDALVPLRVDQDVLLRCVGVAGEGAWNVELDYGRTQVWMGRTEGEPTLDTGDRGYAVVEEISSSSDADVDEELAAFWAFGTGSTSACVVDKHGYVSAPALGREVAARLDDNRAADAGSALFEDALTDPALLFAPLAHGDGPWEGELKLVASLWGPAVTVATQTRVTGRGETAIELASTGKASLIAAWSETGNAQRASAGEDTKVRLARLKRLRVTSHTFESTASVAWADGLPDTLTWTLSIELRDAEDDAWREAATLSYTLERVDQE